MKTKSLFLTLLLLFLLSTSCNAEISGTVVDAETGAPIEGAVVLVEWTKTKGIGLTATDSYKVVEKLTDKDGKFSISGVWSPFVNKPDVTVYKKGYVAWSSRIIFPNHYPRKDFKWKNHSVVQLEGFKAEYTHNDHMSFISSAIRSGFGDKKLIYEAIDWEEEKALEERKRSWGK